MQFQQTTLPACADVAGNSVDKATNLIMNYRRLPKILRRFVPPVSVDDTVQPLIASRKAMWNVLHCDAGKRIQHKDGVVTIVNVHAQLLLVETANDDRFWIPKDSERKRMSLERRDRTRRHISSGPAQAHARPFGARSQYLHCRFPSHGLLVTLVKDLGYDLAAAMAAFGSRTLYRPDRRIANATNYERVKEPKAYQVLQGGKNIYIPVTAGRRTRRGGGFTRTQVLRGLDKMHTKNLLMKNALFEIVYRRQSPLEVSNRTGLRVENLHVYASRLRKHIKAELHPQEKAA
jgi:hypothetical protein